MFFHFGEGIRRALARVVPRAAADIIWEYAVPLKFQILAALFTSTAVFFRTLSRSPLYMSAENRTLAQEAGLSILRGYRLMGLYTASEQHVGHFHVKPKLHCFHHIVIKLGSSAWNPWTDCCFMDEDMIGRVCRRIVRHSGNSQPRIMTRYLALLRFYS